MEKGEGNLNIEVMNQPLIRAFRATVAYDGSGFKGSQLQRNDRSVVGEIDWALARVLDHPVRVKAASRTDSGVHATGQVVGFRTSAPRTADQIRRALNSLLPGDVRITDCREVGFDFHARYSALGKMYLYRILRAAELPPTAREYVLFLPEEKPFRKDLLVREIRAFKGEHDFRAFSPRLEPGENPVKTIWGAAVIEDPPLTGVRFVGSGFLYQMVRRMMGLVIAVASGRVKPGAARKALTDPDKGSIVQLAPSKGLFLEKVMYSEDEVREAVESIGSRGI